MIVYFLLIGFASLMVSVEFIIETRGGKLEKELLSNLKSYSEGRMDADGLFAPVDRLGKKALLMVAIILSVMVIVLTMFIRNITEPLQYMIDKARKISTGDLTQTITIHSHDEIAELGDIINELSGNLQEITLMSRNLCESGLEITEQVIKIFDGPVQADENKAFIIDRMARLRTEFTHLNTFTQYFDFYRIE